MTNHSIIRTEKRAHKNEKSAIRMIILAKERGLHADKFSSKERNYLERKEENGKHALYYAGYCFVFNEEFSCITMFPVPKWFGKKTNYQGKQQIRHAKKYFRNNPDYHNQLERYCMV